MEERYRGSHREGKIKREIGRGERKRDRSGREIERERTTEKERHGGREKDRKRDRGGEIDSHREGEGGTGVRER